MGRLRSCKYCGRIHPTDYDCGRRPVFEKRTALDNFRGTRAWQRKRREIRQRDFNLCRYHLTQNQLVYDDLSVHHIEPLERSWEKRLDDDNLITLCGCCHEAAEAGKIPEKLLKKLAKVPPGALKSVF